MKDKLIQLFKVLKTNQKEFASKIGISPSRLTEVISGRTKALSAEAVASISREYGVNLNWLLTGEGDMFLPGKEPGEGSLDKKDGSGTRALSPEENPGATPIPREKRKNHKGFDVIDGSVEEYPQVDIIEKVSRTKWWKGLTEMEREIIVFAVHLRDDEMKGKVRNILANSLTKQDADDKLNKELREVAEELDVDLLARRQKGEAG